MRKITVPVIGAGDFGGGAGFFDWGKSMFFGMTRCLFALGLVTSCMTVVAQDYPARSIRMIVDGPTGGVNDLWGRRYAQRMSEALGQAIVVDNRPGASGSIAAEALARSAADGYTMMFGGSSPLVSYPSAGGLVRYDPGKDFAVAGLGMFGLPMLVVNSGTGFKSVSDLIAAAKTKPNGLTCGTGGHASVQHFLCAQLARLTGISLRTVPYKGGALALVDASTGIVDIAFGFASELEPYTSSGKLLAIAAVAPRRMPKYPAVPTLTEAGIIGLEFISFSAFIFPRGTPAEILDRINAESVKAMAQPEMRQWATSAGVVYEPMKVGELQTLMLSEQRRWKQMSDELGIRVE